MQSLPRASRSYIRILCLDSDKRVNSKTWPKRLCFDLFIFIIIYTCAMQNSNNATVQVLALPFCYLYSLPQVCFYHWRKGNCCCSLTGYYWSFPMCCQSYIWQIVGLLFACCLSIQELHGRSPADQSNICLKQQFNLTVTASAKSSWGQKETGLSVGDVIECRNLVLHWFLPKKSRGSSFGSRCV